MFFHTFRHIYFTLNATKKILQKEELGEFPHLSTWQQLDFFFSRIKYVIDFAF